MFRRGHRFQSATLLLTLWLCGGSILLAESRVFGPSKDGDCINGISLDTHRAVAQLAAEQFSGNLVSIPPIHERRRTDNAVDDASIHPTV